MTAKSSTVLQAMYDFTVSMGRPPSRGELLALCPSQNPSGLGAVLDELDNRGHVARVDLDHYVLIRTPEGHGIMYFVEICDSVFANEDLP